MTARNRFSSIGCRNTIREYVTINPGTAGGGLVTRIGDDCLFMVGAHVAHDCQIADHVIMANNATLAGHVVVDGLRVSRRAVARSTSSSASAGTR